MSPRLGAAVAAAAVIVAGLLSLAPYSVPGTAVKLVSPVARTLLPDAARSHRGEALLRDLAGSLPWHALLPAQLADGYLVDRVALPQDPATQGFGLFISGPDPAWGHDAIHLDEAPPPAAGAVRDKDPFRDFAPSGMPISLAGRDWLEVSLAPEGRAGLMLMHRDSEVEVVMDGLAPEAVLRAFAAALDRPAVR